MISRILNSSVRARCPRAVRAFVLFAAGFLPMCVTCAAQVPITCVQKGLVALYDGIYNSTNAAGVPVHDELARQWVDWTGHTPSFELGGTATNLETAVLFDGEGWATNMNETMKAVIASANGTFEFPYRMDELVYDGKFCHFAYLDSSHRGFTARPGNVSGGAAWGTFACVEYQQSTYKITNLTPSTGVRHTATFTLDSKNCTIYSDGVQLGTSAKGSVAPATSFMGIGRGSPTDVSTTGLVKYACHGIRVYNRVLSADEIAWNRAYDRMRFDGVPADEAFAGLTPPEGLVAPDENGIFRFRVTVTNATGEATLSADGGGTWGASVTVEIPEGECAQVHDKAGFVRLVPPVPGTYYALANCTGVSSDPTVTAYLRTDGRTVVLFTNVTTSVFLPCGSYLVPESLVVGGGGAGGNTMGGGGGGGGVVFSNETFGVSAMDAFAVTVGAGGTKGGTSQQAGTAGGKSELSFNGLLKGSARGGGGGGGWGDKTGKGGASGGGGCNKGAGGAGTAGQGFDGAAALGVDSRSGGGGGAGGPGQQADEVAKTAGRGGPGVVCSITGTARTYGAGGGGGGSSKDYQTYAGGEAGGDGAGSGGKGSAGTAGLACTGGGGGGGGWTGGNQYGGAGGSGAVFLALDSADPGMTVAGDPELWGADGSPAYGKHRMADGEARTFTAPPTVYLDEGRTVRAVCLGHRMDEFDPETMRWTLGTSTNASTSCECVQSGTAFGRITWIWQKQFLVAITNTASEEVLSLDGGETWFAGTNAWFVPESEVKLALAEDVRDRFVFTGHAGAKDLAAGTFATSATEPMELVARDDLAFVKTLTSTGGVEISTGVVCANHQIEMRVNLTQPNFDNNYVLAANGEKEPAVMTYKKYWYSRGPAGQVSNIRSTAAGIHTILYNDLSTHSLWIDGTQYQAGKMNKATSTVPMTTRFTAGTDLHWIKITAADGTPVRDLRPCLRGGEPVLFDVVNGAFHTNALAGAMTATPFADGIRLDYATGLEWYRVTATNTLDGDVVSADGGLTWGASTSFWVQAGSEVTLNVPETWRRFAEYHGGYGTNDAARGAYSFVATAPADLSVDLQDGGRRRWNDGIGAYEYNVSATNTAGEAVLSLDGGETWFAGTNAWLKKDSVAVFSLHPDACGRFAFTGHAGTEDMAAGTFSATISEAMDVVARDDLTFVQALVGVGSATFIDTGVVCSNHQFAVRFKPKSASTSQVLLGSDDANARSMRLYASGSRWYCRRSSGDAVNCVAVSTSLQTLTYNDVSTHSFYVNGTQYQKGAMAGTTSSVPVAVRFSEGDLHWVQIKRSDGTLVRDMRPCLRGGLPGLFDMVDRAFHPNAGGAVRSLALAEGTRFDTGTGVEWHRVAVTNGTGEATLSADGGETWCAGWTAWATNGATFSATLKEELRRTTGFSGVAAGSFDPAAGTCSFTVAGSAAVTIVPLDGGASRWNEDFTALEHLFVVTNLSGEAVLTDDATDEPTAGMSRWIAAGGAYAVTVAEAANRRVAWGALPAGTVLAGNRFGATFSDVQSHATVTLETFAPTHVWTGAAGTTDWGTYANWEHVGDAVDAPTEESVAYLPAGATAAVTNKVVIPEPIQVKGFYAGAAEGQSGRLEITFSHHEENVVSGNFHVYSNATVTHAALDAAATKPEEENAWINVRAGGYAILDKGATVTANGKGYAATKGPGAINSVGSAHGATRSLGHCYGSLSAPTNSGSGGWDTTGRNQGYRGGGVVRISCVGAMTMNAAISADGVSGGTWWGGGSGGSVWLRAARLAGSGTVSANGGNTAHSDGGGAGGRIAFWQDEATDFGDWKGKATAYGGTPTAHYSSDKVSVVSGGAGTIYLQAAGQTVTNATVIVADNPSLKIYSAFHAWAELNAKCGADAVGTVIVTNNGCVAVDSGAELKVYGDWIARGGRDDMRGGTVRFAGDRAATVTGAMWFPGLACDVPGKRFFFGDLAVDTFGLMASRRIDFTGTAEHPIELGGLGGNRWYSAFGSNCVQNVSHVNVVNADASGGIMGMAYDSSGAVTEGWAIVPTPAPGAAIRWTGARSEDWRDAANWDPERVPVPTDAVTISPGGHDALLCDNGVVVASLAVEAGVVLSLKNADLAVTGNVSVAGGFVLDGGDLSVAGDLAFSGSLVGKFRETLFVEGNADFTGSTISPAEMTIVLNGAGDQTVGFADRKFYDVRVRKPSGELTLSSGVVCRDFDVRESPGLLVRFGAGETFECEQVHWNGFTAVSSVPGAKWLLRLLIGQEVGAVTVSDCDASVGISVFADATSGEGVEGSTVNWFFGSLLQTWASEPKSSDWFDPANWDPAVVPGPTSRVTLVTATAVTCTGRVDVQNLVLGDGRVAAKLSVKAGMGVADCVEVKSNATLTVDKPVAVTNSLLVRTGGTITQTELAGSSTSLDQDIYGVEFDLGGVLLLEPGAKVTADGKGFYGTVPKSGSFMGPGTVNGSGAAHGGSRSLGHCYDSLSCPTNSGSGGWNDTSTRLRGGGRIRIFARKTLTVNGTVTASGPTGGTWIGTGAGGSIWLKGQSLSGSGTLAANGGDTAHTYAVGSGGRIAVHLTEATDFGDWTGTMTAYGGYVSGNYGNYENHVYGGAGTIYLQAAGQTRTNATVIVANNPKWSYSDGVTGSTELGDPATETDFVGTLVVTNNGRVHVGSDRTLDVYGSWFGNGGHFREEADSTARVRFVGGADAVITGSHGFPDTLCETPGKVLRFGSGSGDSFEIFEGRRLTLTGTEENPLVLRGWPDETNEWKMCLRTDCRQTVEYVSPSNSNALAGLPVLAIDSFDAGGNRNWGFSKRIHPNDPIFWTGAAGNGVWSDTANWEDEDGGHRAPVETDRVVIPKPGSDATSWPTLADGVPICNRIQIGEGGSLTLKSCTLYATNELSVAGALVCLGSEKIVCSNEVRFASTGSFVPARSIFRLEGPMDQAVDLNGQPFHRFEIRKEGGSVSFGDGFSAATFDALTENAVAFTFACGKRVAVDEFFCRGRQGSAATAAALTLKGDESGTENRWELALGAVQFISGVRASDSHAVATPARADELSENGGNDVNWDFGARSAEWTGAADSDFANAANWYPETVPGEGVNVFVAPRSGASATVAANGTTSVSNLVVGTSGTGAGAVKFSSAGPLTVGGDFTVGSNVTVVLNSPNVPNAVAGNVLVHAGALLTHDALDASAATVEQEARRFFLTAGGSFTLEKGASVNADGKGFAARKGPGERDDSSGAHGGTRTTGLCYGSLSCPTNCGSGGWDSGHGRGLAGGGSIRIFAGGTLAVNGTVSVNGTTGETWYGTGAGGSIWIKGSRLVGAGKLAANGGDSAHTYAVGSGGRIAVHLTEAEDFGEWNGTMTAYGGYVSANYGNYDGHVYGGAGTIYLKPAGAVPATVKVVNNTTGKYDANITGTTELPPRDAGVPYRVFRDTNWEVGQGAWVSAMANVTLGDLHFVHATSCVKLNGNTVKILSHAHKDGLGWVLPKGETNPIAAHVTFGPEERPGAVVWKPKGTLFMVR